MGELILKVHDSYRMVVAVCDRELLGRKIEAPLSVPQENGGKGIGQLDLTGAFFNGDEISEEQLRDRVEDFLAEDATFNIVGEKSVAFFKEIGLVKDEGVLEIAGVPFALVLL